MVESKDRQDGEKKAASPDLAALPPARGGAPELLADAESPRSRQALPRSSTRRVAARAYSITWLVHQLIGLEKEGAPVFDSIIVVTDRRHPRPADPRHDRGNTPRCARRWDTRSVPETCGGSSSRARRSLFRPSRSFPSSWTRSATNNDGTALCHHHRRGSLQPGRADQPPPCRGHCPRPA